MSTFTVTAVSGIGEVRQGTDLAAELVTGTELRDGDVVVVTSKVVSKAEGRVVRLEDGQSRDAAVAPETDRVVARRGPTRIVRTRHGLVMAAAGVDGSNTEPGTAVLLPEDPDASARVLREQVRSLTGANVAVVITDTSGRAWRTGQTDIAIGAAGLVVLDDHTGRHDRYGNPLQVTAPAVADEIAGAAELATGKLTGRPAAVVRGLGRFVLPVGQHGAGARALIRDEHGDLFGYGTREAVLHALVPHGDLRGFGAPAEASDLAEALTRVVGTDGEVIPDREDGSVSVLIGGPDERTRVLVDARVQAVARAFGWECHQDPPRPVGGTPGAPADGVAAQDVLTLHRGTP